MQLPFNSNLHQRRGRRWIFSFLAGYHMAGRAASITSADRRLQEAIHEIVS
jgi:hypothetical protein